MGSTTILVVFTIAIPALFLIAGLVIVYKYQERKWATMREEAQAIHGLVTFSQTFQILDNEKSTNLVVELDNGESRTFEIDSTRKLSVQTAQKGDTIDMDIYVPSYGKCTVLRFDIVRNRAQAKS